MRRASALALASVSRADCMFSTALLFLLDQDKLLFLLRNSANNLLLNLVELQLASKNLVLLLLKSSFSLGKSSLKLHLLSLQSLADLIDFMDGATSLRDLVHDVLDLIGKSLVLSANIIKMNDTLLIGSLHLEQVRGNISSLLLRVVEITGQGVHLGFPFSNDLVIVLGLPLHLGIHHLGLVKADV